jgi:hypothetical protein
MNIDARVRGNALINVCATRSEGVQSRNISCSNETKMALAVARIDYWSGAISMDTTAWVSTLIDIFTVDKSFVTNEGVSTPQPRDAGASSLVGESISARRINIRMTSRIHAAIEGTFINIYACAINERSTS